MVIINKQAEKISFTVNLNVEFNEITGYNRKNPLTRRQNDCIMISASEQFANGNAVLLRGAVITENRRVVYVCKRSNG